MTIKFAANRPVTYEEEAEIQKMIASDPDAPEATDGEQVQAKVFNRCFLDGTVHPFYLPICPGRVDLSETMFNIVLKACAGLAGHVRDWLACPKLFCHFLPSRKTGINSCDQITDNFRAINLNNLHFLKIQSIFAKKLL